MFAYDMKCKKEIDILIFIRNLIKIDIGEMYRERTGSNLIEK